MPDDLTSPRSPLHVEPLAQRVVVREERLLSDNWYILKTTKFDYRRGDGSWQSLQRETYDRGNGAVVLLVDRARRVVRLTRQFRYPAFVNGWKSMMIEAPAGLLDDAEPEARIRAEAEEEAGVRIRAIRRIFEAYMSPGSVTEKLSFFVADYDEQQVVGEGGGVLAEGEDIEVLELDFDDALQRVESGSIVDAKTMLLLYWARLHVFASEAASRERITLDPHVA